MINLLVTECSASDGAARTGGEWHADPRGPELHLTLSWLLQVCAEGLDLLMAPQKRTLSFHLGVPCGLPAVSTTLKSLGQVTVTCLFIHISEEPQVKDVGSGTEVTCSTMTHAGLCRRREVWDLFPSVIG